MCAKSISCVAISGLDFSHCAVAGSSGTPLSWRSGVPCKIKRVRTVFTPEQLERLEKEFLKQQYMVGTERVDLAATLHLTETQVRNPPSHACSPVQDAHPALFPCSLLKRPCCVEPSPAVVTGEGATEVRVRRAFSCTPGRGYTCCLLRGE